MDILAALEWSRRSGSLGRRGGQTGGVFLRSFPFLASPRARAQSPLWSGDCGREVETLHPTGWPEAGGSGRTSPEKPCPGSFAKRRQRCSRGRCRAGARDTRHPPSPSRLPLAQAPRADRAAVRARRAPRSVQLFSFRGPELGRGDAGGPFGREERRAWSVVARRLHLLHRGWHHLPEGARRRGRLPGRGALRARCGFGKLIQSASASPGGRRIFSQKKTSSSPRVSLSPRLARTLWNLTPLLLAQEPTCEVCPAACFSSRTPGACQG